MTVRPGRPATRDLYRMIRSIRDENRVPLSIKRVFLPIYAVTVDEVQQTTEDYEQVELLFIRAIAYGQIDTIAELATFFGVSISFVRRFLYPALATHFEDRSDGRLVLTELGRRSVQRERHIEHIHGTNILYFEALGLTALGRALYSIPPSSVGQANDEVLEVGAAWDPVALQTLVDAPDKRLRNVPEEVISLEATDVSLLYTPITIVRTCGDRAQGEMTDRVFAYVGDERTHDAILSDALQAQAGWMLPYVLPEGSFDELKRGLDPLLQRTLGVPPGGYTLQQMDDGEWRAVIDTSGDDSATVAITHRLHESTYRLGSSILLGAHIVRLWCTTTALLEDEALTQIVEMLQSWRRAMPRAAALASIARLGARYNVAHPNLHRALAIAQRRGAEAAQRWLEDLTAETDTGLDLLTGD